MFFNLNKSWVFVTECAVLAESVFLGGTVFFAKGDGAGAGCGGALEIGNAVTHSHVIHCNQPPPCCPSTEIQARSRDKIKAHASAPIHEWHSPP